MPIRFKTANYPEQYQIQIKQFCVLGINDEQLKYVTSCFKYDRHGYKLRMRILLLTDKAIYLIDEKTLKLKHRLDLQQINVVLTKHVDNFALIRIPLELIKDKGDLLLVVNNVIEFATYLAYTVQDKNIIYISNKERFVIHTERERERLYL